MENMLLQSSTLVTYIALSQCLSLNLGENVTWPNMQVTRSDSFPKLLEPHNYSAQHNILA